MTTHQNPDRNASRWLLRAGIALASATVVACGSDDTDNRPTEVDTYAASLQAFPSCDDFDDYLVDTFTDVWIDGYVYQSYGYAVAGGMDRGATDDLGAEPSNDGASGGGGGGEESPTDYTTTNVQEIGVDEPDLFKTDGDYMYIVSDQELLIVDSWPADEASLLSRTELPGWGDWMFLADDRVVTISYIYTGEYPDDPGMGRPEPGVDVGGGTDSDAGAPDEAPEPTPDPAPEPDSKDALTDDTEYFSGLRVSVFDVSDRAAPSLVRSFDVQGDFVDARMVDGRIYLVASGFGEQYTPELEALGDALDALDPELDWDASDEERDAAAERLRPLVRDAIASAMSDELRSAFIPDVRTDGSDRTDLFDCTSVMHPATHAGVGMLSVVGFDPQTDEAPAGVGLLANGWTVYGSSTSLYVAQDSRWWSWGSDEPFAQTHIHRFALGDGTPAYAASGSVDGWLLDQFSMSEYGDYLRVATTDETNWWGGGDVAVDVADGGGAVGSGTTEPSTTDATEPPDEDGGSDQKEITFVTDTDEDANNVFVLQQNGAQLEVIGGVRGMAPGEDIFAVRFMGELGYVVTFEQTDPLFVLDLANPESPQLRGELHIPGFSTYLHPFGEGYLMGVGRAGDDDGTIRGLSLRLFDVRDADNPTMAFELEVAGSESWSWSDAEHDHHAFTFHEGRSLLAIPVTLEDYGWDREDYQHFSGVIVYEVSSDRGFTEVGRISHSALVRERYCDPDVLPDDREAEEACGGWEYGWYAWMRRSAFVEDFLFALSDTALTASPIDALDAPVSEVVLY